jgi:hypothetical protein
MARGGTPAPHRIPSRGWREVCVIRIIFVIGAEALAWDAYSLYGTISGNVWAEGSVVFVFLLRVAGDDLMESQHPRWISVSPRGLTIGYLFGPKTLRWGAIRLVPRPAPFGLGWVDCRDTDARGWRRRSHSLTPEQSRAASLFLGLASDASAC